MVQQPAARRFRPPSWRDPRLAVGLLLVLVPTVVGARVTAAADRTTEALAAGTALPVGHLVREGDLVTVRVRLGRGVAEYLAPAAVPPGGAVVLRALSPGELVPGSALGPAAAVDLRPVLLPVPAPVPRGVEPGALVDVWAALPDREVGDGGYLRPRRLVVEAPVYAVLADEAGYVGRDAGVQVMLRDEQVPAVLDAVANGARLDLLPLPGGPS